MIFTPAHRRLLTAALLLLAPTTTMAAEGGHSGGGAPPAHAPAPMANSGNGKPIVVQLEAMLVPAQSARQKDYQTVTPLIEAKYGVRPTEICTFSSRVREAILLTLNAYPVGPRHEDEFILTPETQKLLVERVNMAVGGDKVKKIHVQAAALSLGGGWQSKLPFATVAGCREFLKMEQDGAAPKGEGEKPKSGGH